MSRTAMQKSKKRSNILGYILVAVIIIIIATVVYVQGNEVKSKLSAYSSQEQILDSQISQEQSRSEELDEYEKYVQTKAYAGEQAQEKLGLVKEGEIIFRKDK